MLRSVVKLLAIALVPAAPLLLASPAYAGAEACELISISADASCEVVVEGGCTARCEPLNFTASCAAELYATCDGQCMGTSSATCTGSCRADCEAECNVDPGSFDCSAACRADCGATCEGRCAAGAAG